MGYFRIHVLHTCMLHTHTHTNTHNVKEEVFTGRRQQLTVIAEAERSHWPTVESAYVQTFDEL